MYIESIFKINSLKDNTIEIIIRNFRILGRESRISLLKNKFINKDKNKKNNIKVIGSL